MLMVTVATFEQAVIVAGFMCETRILAVLLMRKNCRGGVKLPVPATVSNVGRADDVLHNPPLASDLVQEGHHAIVERPGVVGVSVWRVSIINSAAIRSLRCGQEKGPAILNFQVIDSEDDFLL